MPPKGGLMVSSGVAVYGYEGYRFPCMAVKAQARIREGILR